MSKQKPNNSIQPQTEVYPSAGQFLYFTAAIVYARTIIHKKDGPPIRGSHSHRTQIAKVEDGYMLIDQEWHIKHP